MTDDDHTLRPCPFCSATVGAVGISSDVLGRVYVRCAQCLAHGPSASPRDHVESPSGAIQEATARAVAAWNGRIDR